MGLTVVAAALKVRYERSTWLRSGVDQGGQTFAAKLERSPEIKQSKSEMMAGATSFHDTGPVLGISSNLTIPTSSASLVDTAGPFSYCLGYNHDACGDLSLARLR